MTTTKPSLFSLELIQAVNDWQRGGSAKQKSRRGKRLKELSRHLPNDFNRVALCCFRQVSLDASNLRKLGDTLQLQETISAWTLDTGVAKDFKGGVPPAGYQGVIFEHVPQPGQVVLNLHALYSNHEFKKACDTLRPQVTGFAQGIGKYGGSQSEVVLEVDSLPLEAVYALGGYSSSRAEIAEMYYGHAPNGSEMEQFDKLLAQSKRKLGPNWVSGQVKDRVLEKFLSILESVKEFQKQSDPSKS